MHKIKDHKNDKVTQKIKPDQHWIFELDADVDIKTHKSNILANILFKNIIT